MKHKKAIVFFGGSGGNFLSNLFNKKKLLNYCNKSNDHVSGVRIRHDYDTEKMSSIVESNECYITHDLRDLPNFPVYHVILIDSNNQKVLRYCHLLQTIKKFTIKNAIHVFYNEIESISEKSFKKNLDLWKHLIKVKDNYINKKSTVYNYNYEDLIIKGNVKGTLFEPYENEIKHYHDKNIKAIYDIDNRYGTNLKRFIP